MAAVVDFSVKSVVVVTGASRGIGCILSVEIAKLVGVGSTIVLVARTEKGLIDTKKRIEELNRSIIVKVVALDLSKPSVSALEGLFDVDLNVELGVIFHNAGQLGTLDVTTELTDISKWREYYDLNVFSVNILNSVFVRKLRHVSSLAVINVTSLAGAKPFQNLAMYGSGKASRDLLFKVFALEEPGITVLNYSPGPVDTNMFHEIVDTVKNEEVKEVFTNLKVQKTVLAVDQTVKKLLEILGTGNFKSGDVVDYYDRV